MMTAEEHAFFKATKPKIGQMKTDLKLFETELAKQTQSYFGLLTSVQGARQQLEVSKSVSGILIFEARGLNCWKIEVGESSDPGTHHADLYDGGRGDFGAQGPQFDLQRSFSHPTTV